MPDIQTSVCCNPSFNTHPNKNICVLLGIHVTGSENMATSVCEMTKNVCNMTMKRSEIPACVSSAPENQAVAVQDIQLRLLSTLIRTIRKQFCSNMQFCSKKYKTDIGCGYFALGRKPQHRRR